MLLGLFGRHTKRYRPPAARERLGRRLARFVTRVLLVTLVVAGLALAGWGGWMLYNFLYRSEYFDLRDVDVELVEGPGLATEPNPDFLRHELRTLLHDAGLDEGNLLQLDAAAVRRTVESHSKVLQATVRKHYPRRLSVKAELREVVALVRHDPILAVDKTGFVTQALSTRSAQATRFPYVTGEDIGAVEVGKLLKSEDLTKALRLLSSLRVGARALAEKISEVHCDNATGNLSVILLGGTEIRFGSGDPLLKMPALETHLQKEKASAEQFVYVDLRFVNAQGVGPVPAKRK